MCILVREGRSRAARWCSKSVPSKKRAARPSIQTPPLPIAACCVRLDDQELAHHPHRRGPLMNEQPERPCPECAEFEQPDAGLDRRRFFTVLGGSVAAALVAREFSVPSDAIAGEPATKAVKPAESLIQELYSTITESQKKSIA